MISYLFIGVLVAFLNYVYRKEANKGYDCCSAKPTVFKVILWVVIWPVVAAVLFYDFLKGE